MPRDLLWHGTKALDITHSMLAGRIERAADELHKYIKRQSSRVQPIAVYNGVKYGLNPSKPGEYPKVVTTEFRKSIMHEFDRASMTARIGSNLRYSIDLQLGTSKLRPRPWLSRGVQEMRGRIISILVNG